MLICETKSNIFCWLEIPCIINCEESKVNLSSSVDLHRFHKFSLDVSSLIVITSAFVNKERSKMRYQFFFVKAMEVKLRSKMSH